MLQLLTSVALWHATFSLKCYVYEKLEDPIEIVEAGDHDTCEITIKDPCGRAFVELRITRGLFKDEDGDDFDCFGGWETTCFCLADFCNGDVHKVKVAYDDVNDYPEECHDNVMQTLEWIMDDIDGRIQRRRSGKWKAMGKTRGKRRRKRSFQLPGANNTKLLPAPPRPASQRTTVLAKKSSSPKNTPSTKPRTAASTRAKARTTPPAIKKPPGRTTKKKTGNKDDPLSKLRPKNEKKKPEPPSVRKKISFITLMIIVAVVICVVLCVGFAIVRKKFQKSKMAKSTSKMSAAVPQPQTSSSSASANAPSKENV
ncbi:hypothetical protein Q1695_001816 [Nippostrongylus brasiliensis]|nr:hypothetical protein Q1695_001816 [Nippostrongylus brasiliensis]